MTNILARKTLQDMGENYAHLFDSISKETNYLIKYIIIPVKDQESKIECIFPINSSKDNSDKTSSFIDKIMNNEFDSLEYLKL